MLINNKGLQPVIDLEREMEEFLENNPKAGEALEQFGIANEQYRKLIEAQNRPIFYTTYSTNAGNVNGELD